MNDGLSAGDILALARDGDGMNNWANNPFIYLVWLALLGGNGGFFGNYITTHGVEQMIDNIITSNNIRIDNVEVHSEAYDMCSSDHLPIVADLTLLF